MFEIERDDMMVKPFWLFIDIMLILVCLAFIYDIELNSALRNIFGFALITIIIFGAATGG